MEEEIGIDLHQNVKPYMYEPSDDQEADRY